MDVGSLTPHSSREIPSHVVTRRVEMSHYALKVAPSIQRDPSRSGVADRANPAAASLRAKLEERTIGGAAQGGVAAAGYPGPQTPRASSGRLSGRSTGHLTPQASPAREPRRPDERVVSVDAVRGRGTRGASAPRANPRVRAEAPVAPAARRCGAPTRGQGGIPVNPIDGFWHPALHSRTLRVMALSRETAPHLRRRWSCPVSMFQSKTGARRCGSRRAVPASISVRAADWSCG